MNRIFTIGNSRAALMKALSLLGNFLIRPDDDYELVLRKRVYKRSTEQNRRMWAILNEIAEGVHPEGKEYSADTWHEYFKGRFIGKEELRLPNGETSVRAISTTTLDVAAFSEYMTQLEAWAAGRGLLFSEDRLAA